MRTNASTNGSDASRVGAFFSSLISRYREKVSPIIKYRLYLSFYLSRRETRRPYQCLRFFQRFSSNLKCNKNECLHSPHSTFCANCLHSALLSTFLLIFKSLRSVDKLIIYMHYCLHSALLSALVCTVCTLVCTICTTS